MTPPAPVARSTTAVPPITTPGQFPAGVKVPPKADPSGSGDAYVNGNPGLQNPAGNPTHPLFGKFTTGKVDTTKAAKHVKEAEQLFAKKNLAKALEAYKKALGANPNDPEVALWCAKLSAGTEDFIGAHEYISLYIALKPEDVKRRGVRVQINEVILQGLDEHFNKLDAGQKQEAQQMAMALMGEIQFDKAHLIAHGSQEQIENLKKMEAEFNALHSKPVAEKEKALASLRQTVQGLVMLASLPFGNPKDAKFIPEEIGRIVTQLYGVIARFAKADSDEAIKKIAPYYEALEAVTSNKPLDAVKPFEIVRSEGLKQLGAGDEAKGKEKLAELEKQAAQLTKEGKKEELQKLLAALPLGLPVAMEFLKQYETDHLRRANLAALEAWDHHLSDEHSAEVEKETSAWNAFIGGTFGLLYRGIAGKKSVFDEINDKTAKERDLLWEVRKRIEKGEANTIQEALKLINDKGPEEMKPRAAELAANSSKDPVGALIAYTSQVKHDKAIEDGLLLLATEGKEVETRKHTAASLNAIIRFHTKDADNKKKADANYSSDLVDSDIVNLFKVAEYTPAAEPVPQKEARK